MTPQQLQRYAPETWRTLLVACYTVARHSHAEGATCNGRDRSSVVDQNECSARPGRACEVLEKGVDDEHAR